MCHTSEPNVDWEKEFATWRVAMERFGRGPPQINADLDAQSQITALQRAYQQSQSEAEDLRKRLHVANRDERIADRARNTVYVLVVLGLLLITCICFVGIWPLMAPRLLDDGREFLTRAKVVTESWFGLIRSNIWSTVILILAVVLSVKIVLWLRRRTLYPLRQDDGRLRRLIVCCDGTWNAPWHGEPTNVKILSDCICRGEVEDGVLQEVEYIEGVGTHWFGRRICGATGYGLSRNIRRAYEFLAKNYRTGDDIFLFGFSRGAYTVRSLAGLVEAVGLLKPDSVRLIPRLYRAYQKRTLSSFHKKFETRLRSWRDLSRGEGTLPIRFLGVWDTVGALGAPTPVLKWLTKRMGWVSFHNTRVGDTVQHAYQALALHEIRREFQPAIWTEKGKRTQILEQAWFTGSHSDVGGGYRQEESALSEISLDWMVRQASALGLRLSVRPATWTAGRPDSIIHEPRTFLYRLSASRFIRPIGRVYLMADETNSLPEYKHETVGVVSAATESATGDPSFPLVEELASHLMTIDQKQQCAEQWDALKRQIDQKVKQEGIEKKLKESVHPTIPPIRILDQNGQKQLDIQGLRLPIGKQTPEELEDQQ